MLDDTYSEALERDPDYLDRWIKEDEAAVFIGFSVRALQNWRVRGGGPGFSKISARSIRYRRRELIDWMVSKIRSNTSE